MIPKSQKQLIQSLKYKKYRQAHRLFVIEGLKSIEEAIENKLPITHVFCTDRFFDHFKSKVKLTFCVGENEIKQISFVTSPSGILALCRLPEGVPNEIPSKSNSWNLMLDTISDPGNLGSILRLADWFGIPTLWASKDTVDVYNPKVIQSSMGSFSRVKVIYTDLDEVLNQTRLPVWGASLEGDSLYLQSFPSSGWLIMGNESLGISSELEKYISKKVKIPKHHAQASVQSLNVAMATAIFLSELHRAAFIK